MKVLNLCKYGGSKQFGYPARQVFLFDSLSKQGVDVLLVGSRSGAAKIPRFKGLRQEYSKGNYSELILNGPSIALGFNIKRILSWAIYELMIFLNLKTIRKFTPDIIFVSSLSILTFVSGVFLKRLFNVPLAIEVRDIHPLTLVEFGKFGKNSLAVRFLSVIEKFGYRNADLLVSTLENFQDHARSVSDCSAPFLWLPMGYSDIYKIDLLSERAGSVVEQINELKSSGKFIVCYAGTHGVANDLERVFHIASSGLPENIHFVFIGDGPLKQGFEISYRNLPNISFISPIPKSDVPGVLSHCDLLLNTWKDIGLYRFGVSPNKWIDYALSKRPFLTTLQADLKVKTIAGNAFVTADGSDAALRSELIRISQLPAEQLTEMGLKGYEYVIQNLSYDKLAADLKAALEETVARHHAGAKK